MSRFLLRLLKIVSTHNSSAIIIVLIVVIAYIAYINRGKLFKGYNQSDTTNRPVTQEDIDRTIEEIRNKKGSQPVVATYAFNEDEKYLLTEVSDKFNELISKRLATDNEHIADRMPQLLDNIDSLSLKELDELDYCYESIMMLYVHLSSILVEADRMHESIELMKIAKQSAQCCEIIRNRTGKAI